MFDTKEKDIVRANGYRAPPSSIVVLVISAVDELEFNVVGETKDAGVDKKSKIHR